MSKLVNRKEVMGYDEVRKFVVEGGVLVEKLKGYCVKGNVWLSGYDERLWDEVGDEVVKFGNGEYLVGFDGEDGIEVVYEVEGGSGIGMNDEMEKGIERLLKKYKGVWEYSGSGMGGRDIGVGGKRIGYWGDKFMKEVKELGKKLKLKVEFDDKRGSDGIVDYDICKVK